MVMIPKLYGRSTCAPCRMLKNYLTKKGVQFDYIDVDEHPEKFAEVQVWSNSIIIPQLAVGMTVVVGLNLPRVIEIVDGLNGR